MKSNTTHNLALAAAFAGLLGGTTARLNAQSAQQSGATTATASANAGVLLVAQDKTPDTAIRIKAYEMSSSFRHQMNAQPRLEPKDISELPL
jgi:hypothetical protein